MSGSLITHWADTTEMPLASKDALIATAASIAGSSRAHRAYAEAVVQEYCVKGEAMVGAQPSQRPNVPKITSTLSAQESKGKAPTATSEPWSLHVLSPNVRYAPAFKPPPPP
jgi:hypothetical protein